MFRDEKTIYYLGIWPEDGWKLWPKIDEGVGVLLGLGAEGACGGRGGRQSQLWVWDRWGRKPSKAFHLLPDGAARA